MGAALAGISCAAGLSGLPVRDGLLNGSCTIIKETEIRMINETSGRTSPI